MKLKDIVKNVENIEVYGNQEIEITNITSDSRNIKQNGLFFAIKGFSLDGTKFIKSAIENGASAIVVDESVDIEDLNLPSNIAIIIAQNIRYALAIFSCNLYNNPSQKLKLIGVTGTKGKTTSTYMIKSILEKAGHKVGLIDDDRWNKFQNKLHDIEELTEYLKNHKLTTKDNLIVEILDTSPILDGITYYDLLKRPSVTLEKLISTLNLDLSYTKDVIEQVEISIKYEGYIKKTLKDADKLKQLESIEIPDDFDYSLVQNIATEARQKFLKIKPKTLGQASRISGVNPSDIAVLSVFLKRYKHD